MISPVHDRPPAKKTHFASVIVEKSKGAGLGGNGISMGFLQKPATVQSAVFTHGAAQHFSRTLFDA